MAEQHDQSNDDCLLCGAIWSGEAGWPLCDTPGCANVCCASCVATTGLSVGDLFYCPACAGGGESAAATSTTPSRLPQQRLYQSVPQGPGRGQPP